MLPFHRRMRVLNMFIAAVLFIPVHREHVGYPRHYNIRFLLNLHIARLAAAGDIDQ